MTDGPRTTLPGQPVHSIAIVGGGTAGAASALFFNRAGFDVTLFEAVEHPAPVGAGIMLQPIGMHVLSRLGLLEPIVARGHRIDRLRCVRSPRSPGATPRVLFDLPYAQWHTDAHGLGLHRGVLFATLFEAARRECRVRTGVSISAVSPDGWLSSPDGQQHGPYDLVVVADGARSTLRRRHRPDCRDDRYPWGALWWLCPDPDGHYQRELLQHVRGATEMIGLLPTGRPVDSDTPVVSMFVSVHRDRAEALRNDLARLKTRLQTLAPPTGAILDHLESPEQLLFAEYRDVRLGDPVSGRLVFVGDAAHAMSPQLGQGANLALYDAMTLADALSDPRFGPPGTHRTRRLRQWTHDRAAHLGFYQRMTRWLTPFFQSDSWLAGQLRDLFMPPATAIPWLRRQMVATMCGVKCGIVSPSLRLPAFSAPERLTT